MVWREVERAHVRGEVLVPDHDVGLTPAVAEVERRVVEVFEEQSQHAVALARAELVDRNRVARVHEEQWTPGHRVGADDRVAVAFEVPTRWVLAIDDDPGATSAFDTDTLFHMTLALSLDGLELRRARRRPADD